ncbi:MAG: glycosyltransferase [Ilumatobacteraceae bacterium]|nr:glycosyltransferase [Ilumatobacteraceae bacterium]
MIWVVSPMLHDTESYRRLREEVVAATTATFGPVRFLVVDDSAGTDADVATLHSLDDVEVLTPPFNLGHQRAIVCGLRHLAPTLADDDVVITMDSGGEDQPADVPRLLAALRESGAALVLAERTKRSEPLLFRVLYVMFRLFFRLIAGITVLSGNFAAQRGDSLKATVHHPSFDLCYSSTLLALRRPTTTVPCARGKRFAGRSRMNTSSLIAHGIRMLLPFSERIAARMLVIAATTFVAVVTLLVLTATGVVSGVSGSVGFTLTLAAGLAFATSFIGFLVLFAGFSQASLRD